MRLGTRVVYVFLPRRSDLRQAPPCARSVNKHGGQSCGDELTPAEWMSLSRLQLLEVVSVQASYLGANVSPVRTGGCCGALWACSGQPEVARGQTHKHIASVDVFGTRGALWRAFTMDPFDSNSAGEEVGCVQQQEANSSRPANHWQDISCRLSGSDIYRRTHGWTRLLETLMEAVCLVVVYSSGILRS